MEDSWNQTLNEVNDGKRRNGKPTRTFLSDVLGRISEDNVLRHEREDPPALRPGRPEDAVVSHTWINGLGEGEHG